ncbi:AAA domain-containing protein [Myceligenerans crystallogenes]|uniref:TM0106 family RecB-like nuclease n=1 Tax=Myceligenerans crystallogenes TaxID=316335 RepID=A0ABN2NCL2_9MICO
MFLLEPGRAETLVYSAGDLVLAGECEFRLLRRLDELLGRIPRRVREEDEMLARTAALGDAHERRVLTSYQSRFGVSRFREADDDVPPGGVVSVPVARHMSHDELMAAHERTLAAMEHGADVVYQASFFDGRFHGRADFLVREPAGGSRTPASGPTSGDTPSSSSGQASGNALASEGGPAMPRYAVYDTKLARRAKVRALLQLAAYADQLLAARIDPTDYLHLILGDRGESHHELGDVLPVFRQRRERLLRVLEEHVSDDAPVAWGDDRWLACGRLGVCADCAEAAATHRDVLLVKGVYERQRVRLAEAGVTTIDALASAQEPPEGMSETRFEGLREQARLQLGLDEGHGSVPLEADGTADGPVPPGGRAAAASHLGPGAGADARLRWKIVDPGPIDRLPPPSPGDIFFDFEGDPLWEEPGPGGSGEPAAIGIDYLFGWVERPSSPGGSPAFRGLWADDPAAERDALVRFVDHVNARRAAHPDLHVYHYAAYEKTHLLSIAARHGTYEDEVDDLLRDGVLVDLYAVVRSALRTSDRSLSIKKLEPLYMRDDPAREGVTDAASSVIEYAEYAQAVVEGRLESAGALRDRILRYNEYDCVSTLRLLEWLRRARAEAAPALPVTRAGAPDDIPLTQTDVQAQAPLPQGNVRAQAPVPQEDVQAQAPLPHEDVRTQAAPAPSARQADRARRAGLAGRIREAVGETVAERSPAQQALAMLGAAVEYHVREAKPYWQEHFARLELPVDEWPGRGSTFQVEGARVTREWEIEAGKQTPSRDLELSGTMLDQSRVGDSDLAAGAKVQVLYDQPVPPAVGELSGRAVRGAHGGGEILDARETATFQDVVLLRERLRRDVAGHEALPVALTPGAGPGHGPQEKAIEAAAATGLGAWTETGALPPGPAADILERRPPRLTRGGDLPPPGPDMVATVTEAVRALDRSYVAVQGPPGTGKTHVGSHVMARLVAEGWRVGVVSQSHAAVENMLRAAITKAGVPAGAVAKKQDGGIGRARAPHAGGAPWQEVDAPGLAEFAAGGARGCVVGGTAWDFAHERWPAEFLDLLVIDEAGQFSLADTIAVARSAQRLLLLGDPRQLPQVSRARHPEPVNTSALAWLTHEEPVLPARLGYFLGTSWRMHPALCRKVSDLAYAGRLEAHDLTARRSLGDVRPGVAQVLVPHEGNRVSSPEEADEVVRQVRSVLGREWRDGAGRRAGAPGAGPGPAREPAAVPARPLDQADVLVVAAYNAQVQTVRRALAEAGLDRVAVGTVDRFQGREAPMVILTLAASSAADVSRGMGFLLARDRLNVAVSRAQWRAVVIRSPRLTDYLPGDFEARGVRHLMELGAFLRLTAAPA